MYMIYKLTCIPSGKSYIGLTKDIDERVAHHKRLSSRCPAIRNAVQKHGWDNFTTTILKAGLSLDEANEMEVLMIESHGTLAPAGYNLQTGGDHRILAEESRQKLSKSHKGKPLSEEHKAKIKATRLVGIPRSAETKAKISAAQQGRRATHEAVERMRLINENKRGKPLSVQHRESIRKARTGTHRSEETKAKIRASLLARKRLVIQPAHSLELQDMEHSVPLPRNSSPE